MTDRQTHSMADYGRVAVVFGGDSSEREISLRSGRAVLDALLAQGIEAFAVDGAAAAIDVAQQGRADRVFNILHGGAGENGALAGALHILQMPFTGCEVAGAALSMDKARSKIMAQAAGIEVPRGWLVHQDNQAQQLAAIGQAGAGPWIVKPNTEGSSVGLFKADSPEQLAQAVRQVLAISTQALVEEFLPGEECTVAVVNGVVLPVVRIQPAAGLYDYEAKYASGETRYHCPSGFAAALEAELQQTGEKAFDALGLRGWGRIDFKLDAAGQPRFLEANTTPGMTETSLVPKAAAAHGWDFQRLVREILNTSFGETGP